VAVAAVAVAVLLFAVVGRDNDGKGQGMTRMMHTWFEEEYNEGHRGIYITIKLDNMERG
jgi:hypothetical protein